MPGAFDQFRRKVSDRSVIEKDHESTGIHMVLASRRNCVIYGLPANSHPATAGAGGEDLTAGRPIILPREMSRIVVEPNLRDMFVLSSFDDKVPFR